MFKPSALGVASCLLFLSLGCPEVPTPADADLAQPADTDLAPPPESEDLGPVDMAYKDLVKARPYLSKAPANYDPSHPWPLLLLLHGYTSSGAAQDAYFGLSKIVDQKGFLYAYPDGTRDRLNNRFWNATDACCGFGGTVDDVAYINAVIDDMSARYRVDPKRVFLIGHSNGGFMVHRMACDAASRIAGGVSLAGANWKDASKCQPSAPVSLLQIHGDADATIAYGGGSNVGVAYPSAHDTVATWVSRNGCAAAATAGQPLDLVTNLAGAETVSESHGGCRAGGAAALWTIRGGSHVPALQATWAATLYDWLAAHPKP